MAEPRSSARLAHGTLEFPGSSWQFLATSYVVMCLLLVLQQLTRLALVDVLVILAPLAALLSSIYAGLHLSAVQRNHSIWPRVAARFRSTSDCRTLGRHARVGDVELPVPYGGATRCFPEDV